MHNDDKFLAYNGIDEAPEITGVDRDRYMAIMFDGNLGRVAKAKKRYLSQFDNTIVVQSASDLSNIDSSKNYMIDGVVDMGSQSIEVPEGGISISGLNGARDTAKLISSEDNYTMFTSPSGGYSGDVVLESCTIDVTGPSSQVFDLDTDDRIELWVENITDASDVTALEGGLVSIVERAS